MSAPAVPLSNMGNGYTIVTHVISPPTESNGTQQSVSSGGPLQKFMKGEPKALGTVQIMIGVLMILFGIVISTNPLSPITVYSGISFWGALMYISTGSLSVSASNKLNRCVVRASLTMNVLSTITAGIAIILLSMDLAILPPCYYYGYDRPYGYESSYRCPSMSQSHGIIGVLLVFSILQFIISISIAAFSCKATCNNEPIVNINVVANPGGCCSVVNPFPTQNTQPWVYGASGVTMSSAPIESPPEYTDRETKCQPDN